MGELFFRLPFARRSRFLTCPCNMSLSQADMVDANYPPVPKKDQSDVGQSDVVEGTRPVRCPSSIAAPAFIHSLRFFFSLSFSGNGFRFHHTTGRDCRIRTPRSCSRMDSPKQQQ
jgi:hypothetical protein